MKRTDEATRWFDFETPYQHADPVLEEPSDRLEQAALEFHQRNPHILPALATVCLQQKRTGRKHWSINAAFEVVRYNAAIAVDTRRYRLNNNHRAFYARWLMRDVPELADFFETRDQGRIAQDYEE